CYPRSATMMDGCNARTFLVAAKEALLGSARVGRRATADRSSLPPQDDRAMEIIRDPLWNNIAVDELAMRLVDTPAFQRLRYVRQLGLAFLVYPGATHSRFEQALGP